MSNAVLMGEAAVFLGLAIVLARHRDVRATFAALGPGHRLLVVLFPALLVAGHVVNREDRAFPFLSWELFTFSFRSDPTFHEYTATRASGREVVLPLLALFPSFGRRLPSSLEHVSCRSCTGVGARVTSRACALRWPRSVGNTIGVTPAIP